jgi:hypothetical protein
MKPYGLVMASPADADYNPFTNWDQEGPDNLGEVTNNTVLLLRGHTTRDAAEALSNALAERGLRPLVIGLPPEGVVLQLEEDHHIIQFTDHGWTIAHPIRERIHLDTLFDCPVRWDEDPGVRGRFVVEWDEEADDWVLGKRL